MLFTRWRLAIRAPGASASRDSWARRLQPERNETEQLGFGAARSQRNADAACRLDDAAGDFQEMQADAGELALAQRMPGGNAIAHVEQQPIGGCVQNEAELVGQRRAATGAIRSGLRLMLLNQVLGLPAGTIDGVVNVLGVTGFQRGDNVADVDATPEHILLVALLRFNPRHNAALSGPGFGGVAGFGIPAQNGKLSLGTARADIVRFRINQPIEYSVASKAEDVIDAVILTPRHGFVATIMTVTADGDAGAGPMPPNAFDQAPQPAANFHARRRFAGPQDHGDRASCRGVVNVDRQKAALVVMGVPFRHLLMAVRDIERVVDVQNDRGGRFCVTPAPDIDQRIGEADDFPQAGCVLPARDGGLRAQIGACFRQPPAGELERRIETQPIKVIAIGIAAGNRQHAGSQHILKRVRDVRGIARIGDQHGKRLGNAAPFLSQGQQHDAAIGGETPTVKRGCEFLAGDGWIWDGKSGIVRHGGCGSGERRATNGFDTHFLRCFNALRYIRLPMTCSG